MSESIKVLIKDHIDKCKKLPDDRERRDKKLRKIAKNIYKELSPYLMRLTEEPPKEKPKEKPKMEIRSSSDAVPNYTVPKKPEVFEIKRDASNTCQARIWGPNKEYPQCNRYKMDDENEYCKIHSSFRPFGEIKK